MAWSAPTTWVAGTLTTASDLNTELRDNLLYLGSTDGTDHFTKLEETSLSTAAASITFSSISTGYRNLMIMARARTNQAAAYGTDVYARFNSDSAANYDSQYLRGQGTSVSAAEALAQTSLRLADVCGDAADAGYHGQFTAWIADYTSTAKNKVVVAKSQRAGTTVSNTINVYTWGSLWRTVNAGITSITLLPAANDFTSGSIFTLYGVP